MPSTPPTETEEFKARNAELKLLKDANDAEERRVEELVRAVGAAAEEFAAEHRVLAKRVEALERCVAAAEAAEPAAAARPTRRSPQTRRMGSSPRRTPGPRWTPSTPRRGWWVPRCGPGTARRRP